MIELRLYREVGVSQERKNISEEGKSWHYNMGWESLMDKDLGNCSGCTGCQWGGLPGPSCCKASYTQGVWTSYCESEDFMEQAAVRRGSEQEEGRAIPQNESENFLRGLHAPVPHQNRRMKGRYHRNGAKYESFWVRV